MAENKKVVVGIVEKIDEEELGESYDFTNTFSEIVDSDTGYSLVDFLNSYLSFLKESTFTLVSGTQPKNTHIGLWVDTSSNNFS